MRRVNVHLSNQQIEQLKALKRETGTAVNALVRFAVARLLADVDKRGIPAILFDTQPETTEPTQQK